MNGSGVNKDCERARLAMLERADGELVPAEAAWLEMHTKACAKCCETLGEILRIDCDAISWGKRLENASPAADCARERLAARMESAQPAPVPIPWIRAAGIALAAMLVLVFWMRHDPQPQAAQTAAQGTALFTEIPYLPRLDPRENSTIVETEIRVATLMEMGYRVTADPEEMVPAELLVGEDGRAHAVRLLSDIHLDGPGD